jgi:TRAP-type C4-dicarboxylate transport system permease small subunit
VTSPSDASAVGSAALQRFRAAYGRVLEVVVIVLMVTLALEVMAGVVYRTLGQALVWYDEVASVLLAWVTYYGAALAALRRAHIGMPSVVAALPVRARIAAILAGEACIIGFFLLLGAYGVEVLRLLAGDTLATVDLPVALTQSVIPVGALLFVIAELVSLPEVLRDARHPPRHAPPPAAIVDGD